MLERDNGLDDALGPAPLLEALPDEDGVKKKPAAATRWVSIDFDCAQGSIPSTTVLLPLCCTTVLSCSAALRCTLAL